MADWVVIEGEKVYTDRLRGFIPPSVPRPRAEDGTLLPRERPVTPPDLGVLTDAIGAATSPQEKADLEDCYWTLVAEGHGDHLARSWRKEYEWLETRRRRLEAMANRPALGAFKNQDGRPSPRGR